MSEQPRKDLKTVIRELGKYPADAFEFVQEGLSYAVVEMHGEMTEAQNTVYKFMHENDLDLDQLEVFHLNGQLPDELAELLQDAGGIEQLNRHVSGEHLCWGLRNYAVSKFGAMASAVLSHWNIRCTRDFGEIVFALVDNDFLQKQPDDGVEDFEEVFQFEEAFDRAFRIDLANFAG